MGRRLAAAFLGSRNYRLYNELCLLSGNSLWMRHVYADCLAQQVDECTLPKISSILTLITPNDFVGTIDLFFTKDARMQDHLITARYTYWHTHILEGLSPQPGIGSML